MRDDYYFEELRSSAADYPGLVLQGYIPDELLDGKSIEVYLKHRGSSDGNTSGDILLSTEIVYSKPLATALRKISSLNVTKMISVIMEIPGVFMRKGDCDTDKLREYELCIYVKDESEADRDIIYTCTGSKVAGILTYINSSIQAVIYDGENTIIKGWVIDKDMPEIEVVDSKGEPVEYEINRLLAPDVMYSYPEYDGQGTVGFFIKAKTGGKSCRIVLKNGHKGASYKIHGLGVLGKTAPGLKLKNISSRASYYLKRHGVKDTGKKIYTTLVAGRGKNISDYTKWISKRMPKEQQLEEQRQKTFEYNPIFSILVPLYESNERLLKRLIESVQEQTYGEWELCFSDGSKDKTRLEGILKPYMEKDKRIKLISDYAAPSKTLGISENTNQAYELATGEYIVLGDHDDLFTPDALYECVKALNIDREIDVIYTDEDKVDEDEKHYFDPSFKPDYNIDLLRSTNYICHMFVVRKELVDKVGLFNTEYDGAQDYDFILRCTEKAKKVHHIAKILYRWRAHSESTANAPEAKLYAYEAGKRALEAHYARLGIDAVVEHGENLGYYKTTYAIKGNPLISIVIPNKDHIDDLKKCIDAIEMRSTYRNYEFIIVENNSTESETFAYYKTLEDRANIKVVYWKDDFNYSAINNFGVQYASGEYILLLNNDIEIITDDCLEQLLGYCQREEVGAVGAKLYYEDDTIQHAGVIVGMGGIAGHAFTGVDEKDGVYMLRSKLSCDYSAVTAACLMTKRSIYDQVGGLDENFKVAFNDIDFCLKICELGKLVVYNANVKLYHYESKSRGTEDTVEKMERFNSEIQLFNQKWPEILVNGDPYYNVNLSLDGRSYGLR